MVVVDGLKNRVSVKAEFTVDEAKALRWFLAQAVLRVPSSVVRDKTVGWSLSDEFKFAQLVAEQLVNALPDGEWETP